MSVVEACMELNEVENRKSAVTRSSCLDQASGIVNCDRENTYGKPEDNFGAIASLWSDYLNIDVNAVDVGMMMILLKIARAKNGKFKADNYVDICGYAACACEIASRV